MLAPHGTREHWHIPTPFSAADGGPISLRLGRPSLHWLVFVIGWTNLAGAALTTLQVEHHMALGIVTHTACVGLAAACARGIAKRSVDERFARLGTGLAALPAVFLPMAAAPLLLPAIFIGTAAMVTAAAELGFRLAPRCGCGVGR